MNKMQTEVAGIVKEIGEKEGYLLIISNLGVLYSPTSIDLTDKIIRNSIKRTKNIHPAGEPEVSIYSIIKGL